MSYGPPCVVDEQTTCLTCGEVEEPEVCPKSERKCGHHCNHTWTHESCCWCGWNVPAEELEALRATVKRWTDADGAQP